LPRFLTSSIYGSNDNLTSTSPEHFVTSNQQKRFHPRLETRSEKPTTSSPALLSPTPGAAQVEGASYKEAMGGALSLFSKLLWSSKEIRILILGLDNAGKTTLLYRLKIGEVVTTIPTIGFNVESVTYKNLNFNVWDLGGQTSIRPYWRCYYANTAAVVFVVDSGDVERLETAAGELRAMLEEEELRDAALLVFANKQDQPGAKGAGEISEALRLGELKDRNWSIMACSAIDGRGVNEGMDWLVVRGDDGRRERCVGNVRRWLTLVAANGRRQFMRRDALTIGVGSGCMVSGVWAQDLRGVRLSNFMTCTMTASDLRQNGSARSLGMETRLATCKVCPDLTTPQAISPVQPWKDHDIDDCHLSASTFWFSPQNMNLEDSILDCPLSENGNAATVAQWQSVSKPTERSLCYETALDGMIRGHTNLRVY